MDGRVKHRHDEAGRECARCNEYKPWESFYKSKNPKAVNGRASSCKTCERSRSLGYYHDNVDARGVYWKQYYADNKEHLIARATEWKRANPERHREHSRVDWWKNRDVRIAARKMREIANPEPYMECHVRKKEAKPMLYRQIANKATRRWRQAHPAEVAAIEQRRRCSKLQAIPGWYDAHAVVQMYVVAKELRNKTGLQFHVDHVIPLQNANVCGLHTHHNLRVVTAGANLSKHNKFCTDSGPIELAGISYEDLRCVSRLASALLSMGVDAGVAMSLMTAVE